MGARVLASSPYSLLRFCEYDVQCGCLNQDGSLTGLIGISSPQRMSAYPLFVFYMDLFLSAKL